MSSSINNSGSSESSMSVSSSNDEVSLHSTISGDSQLDDHRNQNSSLPIRTDSRMVFAASHDHINEQQEQQNLQQNNLAHLRNKKKIKRTNSHDSVGSFGSIPHISEKPSKVIINSNINSRDLLNKMVVNDDEYDEYEVKFNDRYRSDNNNGSNAISFASNSNVPVPLSIPNRRHSKTRSKSFSEQVKSFIRPKEDSITGGILLGSNGNNSNNSNTISMHINSNNDNVDDNTLKPFTSQAIVDSDAMNNDSVSVRNVNYATTNLTKVISRASSRSTRRKVDIDSDVDSHASRESQETEEDVCFPMLPEHIRIRGIDFDEIEEFIIEQREENQRILLREKELRMDSNNSITTSSLKTSSAALKYLPKNIQIKNGTSSSLDTSQKSKTESESNHIGKENFKNDYDLQNVTFNPEGNKHEREEEDDLPTRFSFFSSEREETIHAADIPSLVKPGQLFKDLFEPQDSIWWLDCTCPTDSEMKMLAKAFSIHPLTAEDIRMQETREKVELFKGYYFVSFHTFETDSESEDFLEPINVYIVVFSSGILTFHFSPLINPANVRRRVRQLRDYVNVSADWLCYAMIDDITDGFAPIIQSIEYEADAIEDSVFLSRDNDFGKMLLKIGESRRKVMTLMRLLQGKADVIKMFAKRCQDEAIRFNTSSKTGTAQPRADIALYLGDIQDHIITMFQSLLSYEKIFSRSHSNYLAQLQVESFYSNVKVTDMLSKVTLLGTILVPMNLVTGLFGMNVRVPGNDKDTYAWFGGIVGFIFFIAVASAVGANFYLNYIGRSESGQILKSGISVNGFRFGRRKNDGFNKRNDAVSLPTRFTRYGDW